MSYNRNSAILRDLSVACCEHVAIDSISAALAAEEDLPITNVGDTQTENKRGCLTKKSVA